MKRDPIDFKQIRCHRKNCEGVLFNVTASRLAAGLGHIETKCDRCGDRYVVLPREKNELVYKK